MQRLMVDYLDNVCAAIRGGELRQAARSELADHMRERYDGFIAEGKEPQAAALETIKRMGTPEALGQRITAANRSYKGLIYALFGLILFVGSVFVLGARFDARFVWYVDPIGIFSVLALSAAYSFLCCGRNLTMLKFVQGVKIGALYASGIVFITAFVIFLQGLGENPDGLGLMLATTVLSPLYALLLSAAARIAEKRLSYREPGTIRGLVD
jgi:hypothetical protein